MINDKRLTLCNSCRVSVLSFAILSHSWAACNPSCLTWASRAAIFSWATNPISCHHARVNSDGCFVGGSEYVDCCVWDPPSSWPRCGDTRLSLGEAASSESPSSLPDCSPPPADRTPGPQTAWSQTPELQLPVHIQTYTQIIHPIWPQLNRVIQDHDDKASVHTEKHSLLTNSVV